MMEHIVRFERGHDCIKFECAYNSKACKPGAGGSHGRHGVSVRFVAKGEAGAVQFLLYTGWLPQFSPADGIGYRRIEKWGDFLTPADLGYHSKKQMYEDQTSQGPCEYCDGQPCYYDGSGLNANDAMYALVNGGDEALWKFLDEYYLSVFDEAKYPEPAEFAKGLRK